MWGEQGEKTFLNQSLISGLLAAGIGKKIKCQGIIYKASQCVLGYWMKSLACWKTAAEIKASISFSSLFKRLKIQNLAVNNGAVLFSYIISLLLISKL